jgi:tRNA nucleotidyltransferase/poly(A) polymerase
MLDEIRGEIRDAVANETAFYVGGCLRDAALGLPVTDIDVGCADPAAVAQRFRRARGTALFELSERHRAWRVLTQEGVTVDFVALRGSIEADLQLRDFTANAFAQAVSTGAYVDPLKGVDDIRAGSLRAVSARIFDDDPLRLLRAVRLEDELPLAIEPATVDLIRRYASLVLLSAGERILAELGRLSVAGFRRLDELGLLHELGGSSARLGHLGPDPSSTLRLVATLGERLLDLPVTKELARMTRVLVRAAPPKSLSTRDIHRFRRETEPWATDALHYLGELSAVSQVRAARENDPPEPLLCGDELGVAQGPDVGRLLELVAEERAAGTIATRDDAFELVERHRE